MWLHQNALGGKERPQTSLSLTTICTRRVHIISCGCFMDLRGLPGTARCCCSCKLYEIKVMFIVCCNSLPLPRARVTAFVLTRSYAASMRFWGDGKVEIVTLVCCISLRFSCAPASGFLMAGSCAASSMCLRGDVRVEHVVFVGIVNRVFRGSVTGVARHERCTGTRRPGTRRPRCGHSHRNYYCNI
jgi:hypothetical protein